MQPRCTFSCRNARRVAERNLVRVRQGRFGEGHRRRAEKSVMRPAGLRLLPLSALLLNEKTRATPVGQGRGDMMPIS